MSEAKDALRDELITLMHGYVPPQYNGRDFKRGK